MEYQIPKKYERWLVLDELVVEYLKLNKDINEIKMKDFYEFIKKNKYNYSKKEILEILKYYNPYLCFLKIENNKFGSTIKSKKFIKKLIMYPMLINIDDFFSFDNEKINYVYNNNFGEKQRLNTIININEKNYILLGLMRYFNHHCKKRRTFECDDNDETILHFVGVKKNEEIFINYNVDEKNGNFEQLGFKCCNECCLSK